jgi:hypothetical protein
MKYLENGHVTLPENQPGKPKMGGTVFVYATTKPSDTEKIVDVLKWSTAGTGGDSRGSQIAAQNYDDGRCHQINTGPISVQRQQEFPDHVLGQPDSNVEQWCETDVHIPSTYKTGDIVTVYWVWQWPTNPGVGVYPNGKDEYYTSCAEIEIVDSVSNAPPVHTLAQQDAQSMAVSDFKSRAVLTTSALYTLADGSSATATAGPVSSATTASSAASSATTASSPAPSAASPIAPSTTSTPPSSESTALPIIVLPPFPFTNTSSPSSGPTYNPSNPFPSHPSGNPSFPFFTPPAGHPSPPFSSPGPQSPPLPSFVTVTVTNSVTGVANKAAGATDGVDAGTTKTVTDFVTSYVTAAASVVIVPATASEVQGLPSVVAVPDQAGNAGLIGRSRVFRSDRWWVREFRLLCNDGNLYDGIGVDFLLFYFEMSGVGLLLNKAKAEWRFRCFFLSVLLLMSTFCSWWVNGFNEMIMNDCSMMKICPFALFFFFFLVIVLSYVIRSSVWLLTFLSLPYRRAFFFCRYPDDENYLCFTESQVRDHDQP